MVTADGDQPAVTKQEKDVDQDLNFKIASQIEYYFADVNLRKDKFMKEELAKDNGWVPIATLMTFNRMKSLTEDPAVVINALKTPHPEIADTIEISDDETKVRRKIQFVDLTDEQVAEMNNRTIHFKGITQDATLDEIRAFCSQYGKVVSIEMRRLREDRKFKGCVMCTYSTLEEANAALAGTDVYNKDIEFTRETKVTWQERKDRLEAAWKARKVKKEENGATAEAVKVEEEVEDTDPVKIKGTILVLDRVGADVTFGKIKNFFKQHGAVAYVDVDVPAGKAFIRFNNENEAVSVLKTASITKQENGSGDKGEETEPVIKSEEGTNGKDEPVEKSVPQTDAADSLTDESDDVMIEIGGTKYKASVLMGEEEITHWRNVNKAKKNAALNPKSDHNRNFSRSRGRGFKRGGKGYQGRNDRSDFKRKTRNSEDSSNKKVRAE